MLYQPDGGSSPAQEPQRTNQQVERIPEEGRLIALNRVAEELKGPADNEQTERPAPAKKEQGQRDHNQRNADAVRQLVQPMLVPGFVVFDEGFRHPFTRSRTFGS
jgi:hypothetical protein